MSESTSGQLATFERDLCTANSNARNALILAESTQGAVASSEQSLSTIGASVTQNTRAMGVMQVPLGSVSPTGKIDLAKVKTMATPKIDAKAETQRLACITPGARQAMT